jgi:thymidylate kinase
MIIAIEGHRHSGKTHLINQFFEKNTDPRIIYYKFQFAKYIDDFGLRDQETGPGVHYFSIANVLTILELNKTILKDKILVFDRCIFSAYAWSIYRQRMDKTRLIDEFRLILDSDLFENFKILYVNRGEGISTEKREKDYFGNFEDSNAEKEIFEEIFDTFSNQIKDFDRGNEFKRFTNWFTLSSVDDFNSTLTSLLNTGTLR